MDALETQDREGVHPVLEYLRGIDLDILLTSVSRYGFYLVVKCLTKDATWRLWQSYQRDGLRRVTSILAGDDLLADLGVEKLILTAHIKEAHIHKCMKELE